MDISECFPSKYVGHADLHGQDVSVAVRSVALEDINQDDAERSGRSQKPVLYFQDMVKGLVLNKTNASRIAAMYGPETDHWIGRTITLYTAETEFGGKPVKCVRVRESQATPAPVVTAPAVAAPAAALPQTATVPTGVTF